MSSTQKDRKVRSPTGIDLHTPGDGGTPPTFVEAIAAALHGSFGRSPGAVKTVARLTHANERAVKNWFDAKNAPSGENLVTLLAVSDEVLETVLRLARRDDLVTARTFNRVRENLHRMLELMDDIESDRN